MASKAHLENIFKLVLLGMFVPSCIRHRLFTSLPSAHNELWDESENCVEVIGTSRIIKISLPSSRINYCIRMNYCKINYVNCAEEYRHMNEVASSSSSSGNFKLDAAANTHHHHLLRHRTWLEYHFSVNITKRFEMYHTSFRYQAVTWDLSCGWWWRWCITSHKVKFKYFLWSEIEIFLKWPNATYTSHHHHHFCYLNVIKRRWKFNFI